MFALLVSATPGDAQVKRDGGILDTAMRRELTEQGLVGAVWSTVHGDSTYAGAAGRRRSDQPAAIRIDDRVQVGSIAKTLVATGILRLVTEGRLDLDAPVDSILPRPRIANPWGNKHPVRVRHLLDHTSGLDDARLWQLFNDEPRADTPLLDGFDETRLRLVVRRPPGERVSYSNTGYGLLGLLIERITGQRYEAYLDANLLRPLGMTNSTFEFVTQVGPHADPKLAMGHFERGALAPAVPGFLRPAMQFTTTATDMARFARFLMGDGRIEGQAFVDPELLAAMGVARGTEAARAGLPVGYALGLSIRDRHGAVGRCHGGNTVGYRAMLCTYREQQKAFFISMNADSESANYVRLDSLVVATLDLTPTTKAAPRPSTVDVTAWEGYYVPAPSRFQMVAYLDEVFGFARVTSEDRGIVFRPFQATAAPLDPMGGAVFRAPGRTIPSHALVLSTDSARAITDGLRTFEKVSGWRIAALWASLAVGALSVLYVLVRGVVQLARRRLRITDTAFAPFLILTLGIVVALMLARQSMLEFGASTPANWSLALVTAALPAAALVGLWRGSRLAARSRTAKLDVAACAGILQWSAVLAAWGLLPLRLWS